MNNKQKKIILKNAIIALINVLHSVIFEALPYIDNKGEKRILLKMHEDLSRLLDSVSKQIPKPHLKALENKTDFDYRLWVQAQQVKKAHLTLFEAEFNDLVKKYS